MAAKNAENRAKIPLMAAGNDENNAKIPLMAARVDAITAHIPFMAAREGIFFRACRDMLTPRRGGAATVAEFLTIREVAMSERTYTMEELTSITGVTPRTLRYWSARGWVPAPVFRGRGTRYSREQLVRAAAVATLRRQGITFAEIRRRLATATLSDLEAFVPPPPVAPVVEPPPPAPVNYPARTWQRITLVPGLELHVDLAGGPVLQRLAQAIHDHYAARSPLD
jgi:DNA-binding transcriptional MerR regulator